MIQPIDYDDDMLDGILFRFWIRSASGWPGETAMAISACVTPADYRFALVRLAKKKGINLPVEESCQ